MQINLLCKTEKTKGFNEFGNDLFVDGLRSSGRIYFGFYKQNLNFMVKLPNHFILPKTNILRKYIFALSLADKIIIKSKISITIYMYKYYNKIKYKNFKPQNKTPYLENESSFLK